MDKDLEYTKELRRQAKQCLAATDSKINKINLLKDLKYGTIIRRGKKTFVKIQEIFGEKSGDVLINIYDSNEKVYIEEKEWKNKGSWHTFQIIFVPRFEI